MVATLGTFHPSLSHAQLSFSAILSTGRRTSPRAAEHVSRGDANSLNNPGSLGVRCSERRDARPVSPGGSQYTQDPETCPYLQFDRRTFLTRGQVDATLRSNPRLDWICPFWDGIRGPSPPSRCGGYHGKAHRSRGPVVP